MADSANEMFLQSSCISRLHATHFRRKCGKSGITGKARLAIHHYENGKIRQTTSETQLCGYQTITTRHGGFRAEPSWRAELAALDSP
jgi:hypothetical protein